MTNTLKKIVFYIICCFMLMGCYCTRDKDIPPNYSNLTKSNLSQGKRYFEAGFYKKAMHLLLPLACDGIPSAQYGVGYMYYYGYGVAQDTDVGYFWIKRAADQGFPRAIEALTLIKKDKTMSIKREHWSTRQGMTPD